MSDILIRNMLANTSDHVAGLWYIYAYLIMSYKFCVTFICYIDVLTLVVKSNVGL